MSEQLKELKNKQKLEAIKRMKLLKIMPQVIEDFEKKDIVYYSERQNQLFLAVLYWISNHKEFVYLVEEFERKHKALVYHAQLTHLEYGDNLALFYVSNEEEEWSQDKNDIVNGRLFSRVLNLQCDYDSDFGYIGIKPVMGGVVRTA